VIVERGADRGEGGVVERRDVTPVTSAQKTGVRGVTVNGIGRSLSVSGGGLGLRQV
jgi:hypothetical protein